MSAPQPERMRMDLAYDGTSFAGFAANEGVRTVGGELTAALTRVLGQPVRLTVAGRTDKGVHASGQVCTFDVPVGVDPSRLEPDGLIRRVNALCGPAIAVRAISVVPPGFDARFSATWRRYRYRVLNAATPDPRWANWAWHVDAPLDLHALNQAATPLIGEHDFSGFCRRPPTPPSGEPASLVRRVLDARWTAGTERDADDVLCFDIQATAFCHQMVRSITALLVDVGRGRRRAVDVVGVLRSGDRARSAGVAPPHGLTLVAVGYDGEMSPGSAPRAVPGAVLGSVPGSAQV